MKFPVLLACLGILCTFSSSAFAQTPPSSTQITPYSITPTYTIEQDPEYIESTKVYQRYIQERLQEQKQLREEYNQKIQTIQDPQKKAIVERSDKRLAAINKKRTDEMLTILTKLEAILANITAETASLKRSGIDTKTLDTEISLAQTRVSNAKSAVSTQASLDYVIQIEDEVTLSGKIIRSVIALKHHLFLTYQSVINTKKAITVAAQSLTQARKVLQ